MLTMYKMRHPKADTDRLYVKRKEGGTGLVQIEAAYKAEIVNIAEYLNPLTPNDLYMSRTAPLTSKRCILYIYSTNVGTEYFKHALYSPFFPFKMQFVS